LCVRDITDYRVRVSIEDYDVRAMRNVNAPPETVDGEVIPTLIARNGNGLRYAVISGAGLCRLQIASTHTYSVEREQQDQSRFHDVLLLSRPNRLSANLVYANEDKYTINQFTPPIMADSQLGWLAHCDRDYDL